MHVPFYSNSVLCGAFDKFMNFENSLVLNPNVWPYFSKSRGITHLQTSHGAIGNSYLSNDTKNGLFWHYRRSVSTLQNSQDSNSGAPRKVGNPSKRTKHPLYQSVDRKHAFLCVKFKKWAVYLIQKKSSDKEKGYVGRRRLFCKYQRQS